MVAVEALPQVLGGYFLPDSGLAATLGLSLGAISLIDIYSGLYRRVH